MFLLIKFMKKIKPYLPLSVIKALNFIYYRGYIKLVCFYLDYYESKYCNKYGYPKASLRYRVNGTPELNDFLSEGERCSGDLEKALARIDRHMDSFQNILDFGCGCGRTIRCFEKYAVASSLSGTDIDSAAIDYCRRRFNNIEFSVNQPLPPLDYSSNKFDLVYSISVFTHINEEYQFLWLAELARIVIPGGIVLLSVHGSSSWNTLLPEYVATIRTKGFLYISENIWKRIFPAWYQTAFHSEEYVRAEFSRFFNIIEYIPQGVSDFHDLIILEKQ
jgi:SAM-dependent methyltransferase